MRSASWPNTSRCTVARRPSSAHATAAAPVKLASAVVVIPLVRLAAAPARAIATWPSQSTLRFRCTCVISHGPKSSPSPKPA